MLYLPSHENYGNPVFYEDRVPKASFLITVLVVFAKKRNLMKDISKLNYYYKKAYEKYQENDKEDLKECIVEFIPVIGPATYGTFMNNHNQRRRGILKSVIDGTNYELVQIGVSRPYVKSRHILKYEFLAFISTRILLSVFIILAGIAYFIPFDILKIYLPCVFIGFIVLLGFFNSFYYISMLKYFKFAVTSYKDYIK